MFSHSGVDRHLPVGRPGDLHPAVFQPRRERRDPPRGVLADVRRGREEVEHRPAAQLGLPAAPRREQLAPAVGQLVVERYQQLQRPRGQDLVVSVSGGSGDLQALRHSSAPPGYGCSS
jgi:hypothetical protein